MIELETLIQWYEHSVEQTERSRRLSERDRDYYDNKQLTNDEVSTLKKRGQPPIVINRIKPKVDFLLGTERQQRTDPRAAPRNPTDEDAAHAATDAIRYVCDDQQFSKTRSDVFENICIEGNGGSIIEAKQKGKRIEIVVRRISWDRAFYDPHSRERDFSDAKYKGIVAWLDLEDAVALYGDDKREMLEGGMKEDDGDTYGDKPRWFDQKRNRVKACEVYYQRGEEWFGCVYTKGGFLKEPKASEYLDEDNKPVCPIEFQSCHVDRENQRYGLVRQLIGPQDEINKRRSKALHLISMRQIIAERGAVGDIGKAKREAAKPDGYIEVTPDMRFEFADTNDMAQGNLNLLQEAKAEIDAIGANAALTGKSDKEASGRALQARQQGGLIELGPVMDALRQWQQRVYRQIWYRIRQYWTEEMWVRVTDDENNIKFVGLNQPITQADQIIEQAKEQEMPQAELQALVQKLASDPMMQIPIGVRNNVSEMDMDIVMEDVPDTINIQAEQFELMANMYQAAPDKIPFDIVLEMSTLRNKKQILERIRPKPEQAEQQMQQQQAAADLEMKERQAETTKTVAEVEKTAAETKKIELENLLSEVQLAVQRGVQEAFQSQQPMPDGNALPMQ